MGGRTKAIVLIAALVAVVLALAYRSQPPSQVAEAPADADSGLASQFSGVAIVADADTLRIGARRFRLDGVRTPRPGAMCGDRNIARAAADALRQLTSAHAVTCRISDLPDANGEHLALCRAADIDLNARMVELGMARDWPAYSDGAYAEAEARARAAGLGAWSPDCPAGVWNVDAALR